MTYTGDFLTITQAPLTITANPQTKMRGDADPVLTYSINGLTNGDDSTVVSGTLIRDTGEALGTYSIREGSLSAGTNYSIVYIGNSLTITPAVGINNVMKGTNGKITVYPNPVNTGTKLNVISSYSPAELEGAYLQVIDLTGKLLQHMTIVRPEMQLTMPGTTGIYLVNLVLANGQRTCVKIEVHE